MFGQSGVEVLERPPGPEPNQWRLRDADTNTRNISLTQKGKRYLEKVKNFLGLHRRSTKGGSQERSKVQDVSDEKELRKPPPSDNSCPNLTAAPPASHPLSLSATSTDDYSRDDVLPMADMDDKTSFSNLEQSEELAAGLPEPKPDTKRYTTSMSGLAQHMETESFSRRPSGTSNARVRFDLPEVEPSDEKEVVTSSGTTGADLEHDAPSGAGILPSNPNDILIQHRERNLLRKREESQAAFAGLNDGMGMHVPVRMASDEIRPGVYRGYRFSNGNDQASQEGFRRARGRLNIEPRPLYIRGWKDILAEHSVALQSMDRPVTPRTCLGKSPHKEDEGRLDVSSGRAMELSGRIVEEEPMVESPRRRSRLSFENFDELSMDHPINRRLNDVRRHG